MMTSNKIITLEEMKAERARLKSEGRKLAFTNGCFDILHIGHVDYIEWARNQADALVVALNTDASVRRLKGPKRPVVCQEDRARVVAALCAVDYVIYFDDAEPASVIAEILPDVLVKGEDWAHYVSGRDVVEKHGGRVALAKLVPGKSTTDLIKKIVELYGGENK